MHKVKNKRNRVVSIALPGRGIILQPRGKEGCENKILDDEVDEDAVQALLTSRPPAIRLEEMGGAEEQFDVATERERQRVNAFRKASGLPHRPIKRKKPKSETKPAEKKAEPALVTEAKPQPKPASKKTSKKVSSKPKEN